MVSYNVHLYMQYVDVKNDHATGTHILDKVFKNLKRKNRMTNFLVLWCDFHIICNIEFILNFYRLCIKLNANRLLLQEVLGGLPIVCVLNPMYIHAIPAGIILNDFICTQTFMSIYL